MPEDYIEVIGEWINKDFSLSNIKKPPYVQWNFGSTYIELDGTFTAHELRCLAHYMDPKHEPSWGINGLDNRMG